MNTGALVALVALLSAAGCAKRAQGPLPEPTAGDPTAPYRIKAGDYLDVRFYKTPELNVEVPVRSDGQISLDLLGDVQAAGLTPVELSENLTRGYAKELSEPRVTVIVRSFGGSVYVTGEVKNPSAPVYWMGMTALQAVASAGGFLDTARSQDVILIRREQNRYRGYRLALDAALSGEDFAQDAHLEPGDILYVSKTPIANVDVWVDQYVRKVLPINTIPIGAF